MFFVWAVVGALVMGIAAALLAPKPNLEDARPAKLGDLRFPRSNEGDPIPWILGTVRLEAPVVLWYGDFDAEAITERVKVSNGVFGIGAKYETITKGFNYYVSFDLAWCLGGDAQPTLKKLWFGKKLAYDGSATNGRLTINKPNLLGGEDRRGGVKGYVQVYGGSMSQGRDPYLAGTVSNDIPAYVGQAHTVFRGDTSSKTVRIPILGGYALKLSGGHGGFWIGNSPAVDAIKAEYQRITTYTSGARIGDDMNPIEVIYSSLVSGFAMAGFPVDALDKPSFNAAGLVLKGEGLGMSIKIEKPVNWSDIAEEAMRVADGVLYQDDSTGKIKVALLRSNYDVEQLEVIDEDQITGVSEVSKTTWDQTFNQCRVSYRDRSQNYNEKVATAQDFANINFQQRVKDVNLNMTSVHSAEVAAKIAARQLSVSSVPLFTVEFTAHRGASFLNPGDVFILKYAPYGIDRLVMRVQKVKKGLLDNGEVTINCVQDKFAASDMAFSKPGGTNWEPQKIEPQPVAISRFLETPPWFLKDTGADIDGGETGIVVCAAQPTDRSRRMDVQLSSSAATFDPQVLVGDGLLYAGSFLLKSNWDDGRDTGYSASGFTVEAVDDAGHIIDLGGLDKGGTFLVLMGDEIVQPTNAVDNGDGTYDLKKVYRGLLDTGFEAHTAADRLYVINGVSTRLSQSFEGNTSEYLRIRDITPMGKLAEGSAIKEHVTLGNRAKRPAPPDFTRINNSRSGAQVQNDQDYTLTWRHRNRADDVKKYNASSSTPESGQTYGYQEKVGTGPWSSVVMIGGGDSATITPPAQTGDYQVRVWSYLNGKKSRVADYVTATLVAPPPPP